MVISYSVSAQVRNVDEYDQMFLRAQSMIDDGEYNRAIQILNKITSSELSVVDDTTKVLYNTMYGKVLFLQQNYDTAIVYLSAAIDCHETARFKFPSYIDMMVFMAFACDALDKRDEAAKWYRKALLKGKVVEHNIDLDNCCYLNLGNIYNESGNYNLAQEYYNKIQWVDSLMRVEIHADYWGKMADKYVEYGQNGLWNEAKIINDSLTNYSVIKYGITHPYYLCCLQNEGVIQKCVKDYNKAENIYNKLIQLGLEHHLVSDYVGDAYIRLIETYCDQDKLDQALDLFPKAVNYLKGLRNQNYSEVEPCLYIGLAGVRVEDYELGIMALDKFLMFTPDYMEWGVPYAINKLTWAYLNVGKNQEVINLLSPVLSRGEALPDNFQSLRPLLHKTLGCSYYVIGQRDDAIANLNEAIRLSNGDLKNDTLIQEILSELSGQ